MKPNLEWIRPTKLWFEFEQFPTLLGAKGIATRSKDATRSKGHLWFGQFLLRFAQATKISTLFARRVGS